MKRLWILGLGAVWTSWTVAQQPVSVYPPPAELPFIQIGAQDVPVNPPPAKAPEKMPAPAAIPTTPTTAPAMSQPPTASMLPGTTVPQHWNGPGYAPTPALGGTPCSPGLANCSSCASCDVPCGTPLFPQGCRAGERPLLDQLRTWLGYNPGPRVLPMMIPQGPQHRPLYTYMTPTPNSINCTTGQCAGTAPPVLGFNLAAPRVPSTPAGDRLSHLAHGGDCSNGCPTTCGTPLFPQRLAPTCGLPGYLTPQAYPAASYAPSPSLLSRFVNFFTPNRYGFSPCSWTTPPANCPSCPGPVMAGSSGQWSGGSCANGGCAAPTPMTPSTMPQAMPQPMPQPLPTTPQSSLTPGYRFATPLTQLAPKAQPVVQVQHQAPAASIPFSNP